MHRRTATASADRDGVLREAVLDALAGSPDPAARRAAARVLRDSAEYPEARQALLGGLGTETDEEAAAECAAALCRWACSRPPGNGERRSVVGKLLHSVPAYGEIVRFRLAAPLSAAPLSDEEQARFRALASQGEPEVRRFAVDVLGRRLYEFPSESGSAVAVLSRAVRADSSAAVREAAALALAPEAEQPRVLDALRAALTGDADWEVRAAAARSLGRAASSPSARDALRAAAASDARPEVRSVASRALGALE